MHVWMFKSDDDGTVCLVDRSVMWIELLLRPPSYYLQRMKQKVLVCRVSLMMKIVQVNFHPSDRQIPMHA